MLSLVLCAKLHLPQMRSVPLYKHRSDGERQKEHCLPTLEVSERVRKPLALSSWQVTVFTSLDGLVSKLWIHLACMETAGLFPRGGEHAHVLKPPTA